MYALRQARDLLPGDPDLDRLIQRLEGARGPEPGPVQDAVGVSPAWREVMAQAAQVGGSEATVLIRGETGTGKEVVARAIHRASRRREGPFLAVNCGGLTGEFLATDLFGHERGAFTGAVQRKAGLVERAAGGTLFLDEIGDLPAELQVRLLRFLQEREYERVGGTERLPADVRVIAATNREPDRLRADLYFRLNVFPIRVPPLRERKEDVAPLLEHFVRSYSAKAGKRYAHIDRQSLLRCEEYPWPGNVRELENLVERSVILCPEPVFCLNPFAHAEAAAPGAAATTLDALVRAHIVRTLKLCRGKIYGADGAAALLGLRPSTLQSKMSRLGIERGQPPRGGLE